MNKWLQSGLILSLAVLTACTTTQTNQLNQPPSGLNKQAPAKLVRIVPEYRQDAPDRYVVRRGDTLWGIAAKFLKHPGHWKQIWHANPQIKNPNRIYPGDVISYVSVGGKRKLQVAGSSNPVRSGKYTGKRTRDGRPIYKMKPSVHTQYLEDPIPTVPKEAVYSFMSKNLVLEPGFSDDYPYIVGQADGNYISLSGRSEVYAKTDGDFAHEEYDVFREAGAIQDPLSGHLIGVEAVYVGKIRLVKPANEDGVGTFMQTESANPLYPNDVLIPSEAVQYGGELSFFPKLAELESEDGEAMVIKPIGSYNSRSASQFDTVLVNVGEGDGIEAGSVFKIVRAKAQVGRGRGGETFRLPDYEVGIGMVYKTFDNVSYALVMSSTDVIYPGDRILQP